MTIILEWSYDDENDSNRDVYASYLEFSELNGNITNRVEYIYVCSGYIDHILKNKDKIIKFNESVAILPNIYSCDKKASDLCNKLPSYLINKGGIVYKVPSEIDGSELEVYFYEIKQYCCIHSSNIKAHWYEIDSEIILVFENAKRK